MDPFTIAAGISAAGKLFSGLSGLFGGNSKAKQEEYAAQQARDEAGVAPSQALAQGDAVASRAATQAAANGGGLVGSSIGVIQDLSQKAMFNARSAVYRGETEARAHLYQAKVAKAEGLQSLIGGVLGAAASVAGGVGQAQQAGAQLGDMKSLAGLF